jgi:glycosyltransferase involved in cell wall biosynthesis
MLSIIIPVYNEEAILKDSLSRVLAELETHQHDFEIIIASNGSTDRTVEIATRLAEEDRRISVFQIDECAPGRAFAQAARQARGEFLITLDADLSSDLIFIEYAASPSVGKSALYSCSPGVVRCARY